VSAATVARYFPVKEAMLFGESELRTAALYHAVRSRPAGEAPIEAVLAALGEQPPLDREGRDRLAASRRAIARSTVARGRAALFLDVWRGAVARALRDRGVDAGEADLVAAVTVAVLDAVADRWSQSDDNHPLEPALTAAFETIGWTTPASTERTSP
jgi:AcrR family transcriptional regulator